MSTMVMWLIFFAVVAVILLISTLSKKKFTVLEIAIIGVMAALAYVAYVFLKIPVTLNGSTSSIHIGNAFPALTALLLDGVCGGLAGAIGLALADIVAGTPHYAITTFVLKYIIGITCGFVAHRVFRLRERSPKEGLRYYGAVILSAMSGLALNIVTDPFLGYFRKVYIQGLTTDFASVLTKISSAVTSVNSLICTLIAVILYLALRPALQKSGLLRRSERSAK